MEPTPGAGPRYDRGVIWEPFVLALFLGLIVSAGLYFAYMWPSVEPLDVEPVATAADSPTAAPVDNDADEEQSAATRKAEARKADSKAPDDKKVSAKKADDKLAEAKRSADKKAAEQKADERKVEDRKGDDVEAKPAEKPDDKQADTDEASATS